MLFDEKPSRKKMPHTPPLWVPENATFFITINCLQRGVNQLAHIEVSEVLIHAWLHYRKIKGVDPMLIMVMPDHIHLLASFSWKEGQGMNEVVRAWKRFTARKCHIQWQREYFDHRIRDSKDMEQKWDYVIHNPLNKGLVSCSDQWLHRWVHPDAGF